MDTHDFVAELDATIERRKKMTSRLYQLILAGRAPRTLLRAFVVHRYPIKNLWTRNILGIACRVDEYDLRWPLVENVYEEETGKLSGSSRHLDTFVRFGDCVGVDRAALGSTPLLPETDAVMQHNIRACNSEVHFTAGVASVLLLMEGQPPIVSTRGESMEAVMRDVYGLPHEGYEFFTHHASSGAEDEGASELEDVHAAAARTLLRKYCTTEALRAQAREFLDRALDARHRHFDAIHDRFFDEREAPFRYREAGGVGAAEKIA
jgi:pyrroloquinoline-quinone synthase